MKPVKEILDRIRWDAEFARPRFEIGYYDRVLDRVLRVSFAQVWFDPQDRSRFQLLDAEGQVHSIPYHRVRDIYRDGLRIWHREHGAHVTPDNES